MREFFSAGRADFPLFVEQIAAMRAATAHGHPAMRTEAVPLLKKGGAAGTLNLHAVLRAEHP